jgi:hypothetical protein
MAHDHHHHHDPSSYYTEQLCTVAFSAAFGAIAVYFYASGKVNNILNQGLLQYSLLAGGILLLTIVAIRAVALWFSVGNPEAACGHNHGEDCCDHDHDHDHDHEHEHAVTTATHGLPLVTESAHEHEHDHSHDHGHSHAHGDGHSHGGHDHDHGWAPVRYIVLLVPILMSFAPKEALSAGANADYSGEIDPEWAKAVDAKRQIGELSFKELVGAAEDEGRREFYDGGIATITGQFVPSNDSNRFNLVRMRIRCCAADAVSLPVPIFINDSLVEDVPLEQRVKDLEKLKELNRKWVEVTCQIQFHKRPDMPNAWIAVLVVRPTKDKSVLDLIKPTRPDSNPYI